MLEELLDEVLVFGGCACLPPRPFSSVSLFSSQDFPAPAGAGWAGSAGACRSFRSFRGFRDSGVLGLLGVSRVSGD